MYLSLLFFFFFWFFFPESMNSLTVLSETDKQDKGGQTSEHQNIEAGGWFQDGLA